MRHSFARRPEDERAERASGRRRWFVVLGVVLTLIGVSYAWDRVGPYFRKYPQPKEPRRIDVLGESRLVRWSLARGSSFSERLPVTVTVCTDGTVVYDFEVFDFDNPQRRFTDQATPSQIEGLAAAFVKADLMGLRTDYSRVDRTCSAWFEIYQLEGTNSSCVRYYGGDDSAPKELEDLVTAICEALAIDDWQAKLTDTTLPNSTESR